MRTKLFKIAHILRCSVLGEYSRVTMLKKMFQLPTMRVGPLVKWLSRYSAQSIFVVYYFFYIMRTTQIYSPSTVHIYLRFS